MNTYKKRQRAILKQVQRAATRPGEGLGWSASLERLAGMFDALDAEPAPPGGNWRERVELAVGMAAAAARLAIAAPLSAPVGDLVRSDKERRQDFILGLKMALRSTAAMGSWPAGLGALNELIDALDSEVAHEHGNLREVDTILAQIAATAARLSMNSPPLLGDQGGAP